MNRQQANSKITFRRLLPTIFCGTTGLLAAMGAAGFGASEGWPFLPCLLAAMSGSALGAYFDEFAVFKKLCPEFMPGERAFVAAAAGLGGFLTCFFFMHGRQDAFPLFYASGANLAGFIPALFGARRLVRQGRTPSDAASSNHLPAIDLRRPSPSIKPAVATNEPIYLAVLVEKSGRIDGRAFGGDSKSTFYRPKSFRGRAVAMAS